MTRWNYNKKGFTTWRKTVASAGTAEKLHDGLPIPDGFQIIVKALDANTGDVEIGNSQAQAQSVSAFILDAGQSIGLKLDDASKVWIDVTVNGEGVVCYVEQY